MEDLQVKHIITKDGSSTLYSPRFDEHYHSVHGAIQESLHVFLKMGLEALPPEKTEIQLLEMGFGTGLNAILTLLNTGTRKIFYTGIESYPVPPKVAEELNYAEAIHGEGTAESFAKLHAAAWDEWVEINKQFSLQKVHGRLEDFQVEPQFDLVYFDAFAPNAQPELWTDEMLQRIFNMMNPGGVFVTYSAKSSVRRGLIAAGFEIEKLPGPPGKREMLRGTKPLLD